MYHRLNVKEDVIKYRPHAMIEILRLQIVCKFFSPFAFNFILLLSPLFYHEFKIAIKWQFCTIKVKKKGTLCTYGTLEFKHIQKWCIFRSAGKHSFNFLGLSHLK